jgi:hypothetical protein
LYQQLEEASIKNWERVGILRSFIYPPPPTLSTKK